MKQKQTQAATRHTPGPYQFEIRRWPNGELMGRPYIYAPNGPDTHRHVAEVCVDGTAPKEIQAMQEAAGRLLAAAPDLLKALEWFVDEAESMGTGYNGSFELLSEARAAIAKAEANP